MQNISASYAALFKTLAKFTAWSLRRDCGSGAAMTTIIFLSFSPPIKHSRTGLMEWQKNLLAALPVTTREDGKNYFILPRKNGLPA
jgi:hypothetical protein